LLEIMSTAVPVTIDRQALCPAALMQSSGS
jgi:hypothetical protein